MSLCKVRFIFKCSSKCIYILYIHLELDHKRVHFVQPLDWSTDNLSPLADYHCPGFYSFNKITDTLPVGLIQVDSY